MAHKKISKKATKKAVKPKGGWGGQEQLRKHNLKNDPRSGKFTAAGAKKQRKLVGIKSLKNASWGGFAKGAALAVGGGLLAGGVAIGLQRVGGIKGIIRAGQKYKRARTVGRSMTRAGKIAGIQNRIREMHIAMEDIKSSTYLRKRGLMSKKAYNLVFSKNLNTLSKRRR